MSSATSSRAEHEIAHGKTLALGHPEDVWGWGSPAGRLRAQRRGRMIVAGARLGPGVRVLEIGCGTGLFTEAFAASGADVVAVEVSAELLDRASARQFPPGRVRLLQKRFEDCAADGPFDAVVGSSVLHHLDIEAAVSRIYELLAPGGRLCFTEPNMLNPQIAVQKNVLWVKSRLGESPDETAFLRWRLRRLLHRAGFEDVRLRPFDWLHPATPRALIWPVRRAGGLLERTPVLREFAGSLFIRGVRPQAR
jgi:SAM-dependent methyltransferase